MNRLALVVSVLGIVLCLPQATYAHVLVRDTDRQVGSILHISPDDDPVAGKPSELFFDIQGTSIDKNARATLTVTNENEHTKPETIATKVRDNGVSASYTFPSQGAYIVRLEIVKNNKTFTFSHTQRITRGAILSTQDKPVHAWAEAVLIFTVCAFGVLMIVGFNRRKEILERSK
jgi:hypothetical protein